MSLFLRIVGILWLVRWRFQYAALLACWVMQFIPGGLDDMADPRRSPRQPMPLDLKTQAMPNFGTPFPVRAQLRITGGNAFRFAEFRLAVPVPNVIANQVRECVSDLPNFGSALSPVRCHQDSDWNQ